jgi:hypothetical protein
VAPVTEIAHRTVSTAEHERNHSSDCHSLGATSLVRRANQRQQRVRRK